MGTTISRTSIEASMFMAHDVQFFMHMVPIRMLLNLKLDFDWTF